MSNASDRKMYSATDARQGEIILRARRHRITIHRQLDGAGRPGLIFQLVQACRSKAALMM